MSETAEDLAGLVFDLTGRVMALEALVNRLLASHAQMHPTGVAARMIEDVDGVVASVASGLPENLRFLAPIIATYLDHDIRRAADLRDGLA